MLFIEKSQPFHLIDPGIQLALQKPFGHSGIRMNAAEKIDNIAILDQQAGKILDIQIAEQIGMVFNIDPQKNNVGILCSQRLECRTPSPAGPAPVRAKTRDNPRTVCQRRIQKGIVRFFELEKRHNGSQQGKAVNLGKLF